jgi:hypothetical protein
VCSAAEEEYGVTEVDDKAIDVLFDEMDIDHDQVRTHAPHVPHAH